MFTEKRRRKERRQKEKEQKKLKANEEALEGTRGSGSGKSSSNEDDDEVESESEESSSEETKDLQGNQNNKKPVQHHQNDEGEVSSVTTRQNKTERNHYILRMAIDEKFIPASIQNLRFAAYIIFFILLMLASNYCLTYITKL